MELVLSRPVAGDRRREGSGGLVGDTSVTQVALSPMRTFEELYEDERRSMLALAIALTGQRAIAEELVQEAFLAAHRHWRKVSTMDRPGAWVRRVLLNQCTSRRRRLMVEARGLVRLGNERPSSHDATGAGDATAFWAEVRSLPTRQAQVVVLYYGEDRATADIAEILEMAEGTVRAQLANARRSLAERLGADVEEDRS